jgi:hypothetical protein
MLKHKFPMTTVLITGFIVMALAVWQGNLPAAAAPQAQLTPFLTPTPGPDGRILYTVQEGDTLLRISLISGVELNELRGLNNLTGDSIFAGQQLLLGLGGPPQVTPTPGPSPTPTPLLPTPSPVSGKGVICVLLYDDINGDALRQEEEPSLPGGAININNRQGDIAITEPSQSGVDPQCYTDLPEGEYTISIAIPEGYNQTTINSFTLRLKAGDETYLDFGAQVNSVKAAEAPAPTSQGGRSPLLGILGALFLLAGIGLALFAGRLVRGK